MKTGGCVINAAKYPGHLILDILALLGGDDEPRQRLYEWANPVMDIHWVTDKIAVSGRQPKSAMQEMQRMGIKSVLNLTIRHDPNWPFQTTEDGLPDDGLPKPSAWFGKGIGFVLRAQHQGKVLIHCEAGVNRSPSMAYAVLRAMGRSPIEAADLVLRAVPRANLRYQQDAESALHDLRLVHDA